MIKNVDMFFQYKNTIPAPPQSPQDMYKQACANDDVTIKSWLPQWIANAKHTHQVFGGFKERGVHKLYGKNKYKPCIVVGSGPSLKNNIEELKKVKGIPIISCLHNYHYMVDHGINVEYYVSLDAGPVVIEEISEGGKLTPQEYIESTKGKKLIAFVGSHPSLWENWKGEVILFNSPVSEEYRNEIDKLEKFHIYLSTGGNVLGACTYIAKAILGSNPIIFVGADFCFSYTRKFHAWDSKYDAQVGHAIRCVDVYGNSVLTWPSYLNFKIWFEWLSQNVAGIYINCTEGGLMGSYAEGNIESIKQMSLKDCLWMYEMSEEIREFMDPDKELNEVQLLF